MNGTLEQPQSPHGQPNEFIVTGHESKKFDPVVVPDDVYVARCEEVKTCTRKFGPGFIFEFSIVDGPHMGKRLAYFTYQDMTTNAKLGKLATTLGYSFINKQVNVKDFVGKTVKILTTQIEGTDDNGLKVKKSVIDKILSLGTPKLETPVSTYITQRGMEDVA